MNLYERTTEMLRNRKVPFKRIEAETGLNYNWIVKISQGKIPDPGVQKIQRLHDFLSKHQQ